MSKLNYCFISIFVLFECAFAWTGFESLGGGVNNVASCSWGPGRIDVFGVANSGETWHKSFSGNAWSGWENLGGVTKLKPSAFSIKPNWVDVVVTGPDQMLYRKTWNGNTWIDWRKTTNGGIFISGPTITASPGETNALHVFGVSTDKALYHSIVYINDDTWTSWENLGGGLVGDPAAVSWGPNRFDIFSIAGDEQLWQKTYDNGWQNWKLISGGLFKPGVGAASKSTGSINVFMRGKDDAVFHRSFSSGNWYGVENIGGAIRGSPSAVSTGSTRVDVFAVGGSDAAVYRSYWDTRNDKDPTN